MTARDRYRRVSGYVRAQARKERLGRAIGWRPVDPVSEGNLCELARREAHAWSRLPERARAAILNPAPEVKP